MAPPPGGHDEFVAPNWRLRLEACGLVDFERLWQLELPHLDAANLTRGGISTVSLLKAEVGGGGRLRLVIKRQHNHQSRTWRHPLRGIPTLRKEFLNIQRFDRCGLTTAPLVLFAQRQETQGMRAILVTEYLETHCSFATLLEQWASGATTPTEDRDAILRSIADLIARMHRAGFRHNCLYPKHVWVKSRKPRPAVKLIDLEKVARTWRANRRMIRDLAAFFRRSPYWSPSDQMRFLVHYHGAEQMTPRIEKVWRQIRRCMARKKASRAASQPDRKA